MEVAKTATSFWLFGALFSIIAFLLVGVILNVTQVLGLVFFSHFYSINSSNWMTLMTFLVAFVFLRGLDLDLKLACINRRGIVRLSFIFIPMLPIGFVLVFLCWSIAF